MVIMVIGLLFHCLVLVAHVAGSDVDRFEDLPLWLRGALPVIGCGLLLLLMHFLKVDGREVGVPHTLYQVLHGNGKMPTRNAVMQMASVIVALGTGFSGGRDGPGLHIGAWIAWLVRTRFKLTPVEVDLLLRAGMTAAIAAGFNTTFAAVFFVAAIVKTTPLSIRNIVPLVVAAAIANLGATWLGMDQIVIIRHSLTFLDAWEWLLVVGMAVPCALVGIVTVRLVSDLAKIPWPPYARIGVIATITAAFAVVMPEIMGLGQDTLNRLAQGLLLTNILWLCAFVLFKMLLTSASVAFGIPLGVIAPTIVTGGALGALCYVVFSLLFPDLLHAHVSVYVLLGAVALLGTVCNAPLAAILMFFELTLNGFVTAQVALTILLAHQLKSRIWRPESIFESRLNELVNVKQAKGTVG